MPNKPHPLAAAASKLQEAADNLDNTNPRIAAALKVAIAEVETEATTHSDTVDPTADMPDAPNQPAALLMGVDLGSPGGDRSVEVQPAPALKPSKSLAVELVAETTPAPTITDTATAREIFSEMINGDPTSTTRTRLIEGDPPYILPSDRDSGPPSDRDSGPPSDRDSGPPSDRGQPATLTTNNDPQAAFDHWLRTPEGQQVTDSRLPTDYGRIAAILRENARVAFFAGRRG